MDRPTADDVASLATAMADATDTRELADDLLRGLLDLIPAISASYNELDVARGRAFARILPEPRADWWGRFQPVFERHMDQNPLLVEIATTGSLPATTWDDVDPHRSFRATDLFREFYLPLGIESQLAAAFTASDGTVVGIAVNRGPEGFDDRERAVLDASLPLIGLARRTVALAAEQDALRRLLAQEGWRAAEVDGDGVVVQAEEGSRLTPGETVGAAVADALAAAQPRWDDHEVLASLARTVDPEAQSQVVAVGRAVAPHLVLVKPAADGTRTDLRALGLTRRQAEVATLLATGADNDQIGAALGISPATVKKHLEPIYAALGVHHRGAAVAALTAAGGGKLRRR